MVIGIINSKIYKMEIVGINYKVSTLSKMYQTVSGKMSKMPKLMIRAIRYRRTDGPTQIIEKNTLTRNYQINFSLHSKPIY